MSTRGGRRALLALTVLLLALHAEGKSSSGRELLGSAKKPTLAADFKCDDVESMLSAVNSNDTKGLELCCPESGECFTFCRSKNKCPGFHIEGLGTVYAQYRTALRPSRNIHQKVSLPSALRRFSSTKPCLLPGGKGTDWRCNNKPKTEAPDSPFKFQDGTVLASNGKCAIKWGFSREIFKDQITNPEPPPANGGKLRAVSRRDVRSKGRARRSRRSKMLSGLSKEPETSEINPPIHDTTYYVDFLRATLCNQISGKCAQRKRLVNCIKFRKSNGEARHCTVGDSLVYSGLM